MFTVILGVVKESIDKDERIVFDTILLFNFYDEKVTSLILIF